MEKYLTEVHSLKLDSIQSHNFDDIEFTPKEIKLEKTSKEFYSKAKTIYGNFKLWFNPMKYIYETFMNVYHYPFFMIRHDILDELINKKGKTIPKLSNVYHYINLSHVNALLNCYTFLKSSTNMLLVSNASDPTRELFLYSSINYPYKTTIDHFIPKNTININKKYDRMFLFNFTGRLPDSENKEIPSNKNIYQSLSIIFDHLNKGGNCIFYAVSFFENISITALLILSSYFENVYLERPDLYTYSWGCFVICKNYKGNADKINKKIKEVIPKLTSNTNYILDIEKYNYNDILAFNHEMISKLKIYLNPILFNGKEYIEALINLYYNLKGSIVITTYYVDKYIKDVLKDIPKKGKTVLYYNLKNINQLFEYDNIYTYNTEINSDKLLNIKELILIPNLKFELILLKISSKTKINELNKLWNLLNKTGKMIILYLKKENKRKLDCFIDDIKCKVIDKGLVVIIEKL